jgi:hypothetical protein
VQAKIFKKAKRKSSTDSSKFSLFSNAQSMMPTNSRLVARVKVITEGKSLTRRGKIS